MMPRTILLLHNLSLWIALCLMDRNCAADQPAIRLDTVMTSPKNFRPAWSHARDYGFVALNPFGLNAFTQADKQEIVVQKGESLRIGYAVAVHEHPQQADYDPQKVYERLVAEETSSNHGRE